MSLLQPRPASPVPGSPAPPASVPAASLSLAAARHASAWPILDPRDTARPDVAGGARFAGASPTGFAVDRLDAVDAVAHRDAWIDLVGRALEPNAFLDPDFALPAAQHLAGRRRPRFVLVWSTGGGAAGGRGDLVAVCPLVAGRGPLRGLACSWLHDLSTIGLPLLDRERAEVALAALLSWAGEHLGGAAGLVVPSLPSDGPTATALRRVAASGGRDLAVLAAWKRAALRTGGTVDERGSGRAGLPALSAKNAKELRRQRRRLAERGTLSFVSVADPEALRGEVERFLDLEAGGWKGAGGTAMLSSPGRTAFLRTATRLLARRGLCRIDSLMLDGAPVAMAVVLSAGDADFLWKIAYREDVARFSPGVQLVLDLTEAVQGARDGAPGRSGRPAVIDSCAVPDHPMIGRLWRDRMELCDIAVSTRPGDGAGFRRAVALERVARRLRAEAKRLLHAWRVRRGRRGLRSAGEAAP